MKIFKIHTVKNYTLLLPAIIITFFATLSSCEKVDVSAYTQQAVVESYLEDSTVISLTVTKESLYSGDTNTVQSPIDGLTVKIANAGKTYTLKGKGNGAYEATGIIARAGQTYDLAFDYNGKTVSATTTIPADPTGAKIDLTATAGTVPSVTIPSSFGPGSVRPEPITVTWANASKDYYYVAVICTETTPVELTRPAVFGILPNTRNNRRFTNSPVNGTSSAIQPQNFRYKGKHLIVLYKVNPEYVKLYETTGSNSLNISTPPTNIKNGLGIFTGAGAVAFPIVVKQ